MSKICLISYNSYICLNEIQMLKWRIVPPKCLFHVATLSLMYSKLYQIFLPALPKNLPIILFHSHIITYYSHIIFYALLFQVLTSRQTWTRYIFSYSYCINSIVMYIHNKLMVHDRYTLIEQSAHLFFSFC